MKHLILLLIVCLTLPACTTSQVDSVGVGATYTDPDTHAEYGGNVNVHLRDRDPKTVRHPQATNPESFGHALARGLARMADGPYPDPTRPSLEETIFGQKAR